MNGTIISLLSPRQQRVNSVLAHQFSQAGVELYLVGGVIRDALLSGQGDGDLDYSTSATPTQSRQLLEQGAASAVYLIGERFGTVAAIFDQRPNAVNVEITSYRREVYPNDTRFPEIEFNATLADDLGRRDFTMNAIAVEARTGEVVDPWDGRADIATALVRAVADADERFQEDPLRLLRAARFVAQLGFRLDPPTEEAMTRQAHNLSRISQERILAELTRLLLGPYVDHGLDVLRRTGLLEIALPELTQLAAEAGASAPSRPGREKDLWDHTIRVVHQTPARAAVRWAALLHDAGKPLTRSVDQDGDIHFFGHELVGSNIASRTLNRLKADKTLRSSVRALVELHGRPASYDASWTDSAVRRLALGAGVNWDDLLDLAAADVTSGRERKRIEATRRVSDLRQHFQRLQEETELSKIDSPLDGDDLMRMFELPPGPWIKRVKQTLRDMVIDGELSSGDRDRAAVIARSLVREDHALHDGKGPDAIADSEPRISP